MIIYGVALLAICTLVGISIGQVLGHLLGLPANVGGVGIAMILLILSGSYLNKKGVIDPKTEQGVEFWSAVYIPVVVAMAAKQNVFGAFSGGAMAISAGVTAVVLGFALVPVLDRMGKEKTQASKSISSPSTDRV
ncbi:malonate transporter subunit MadL [Marinomonas spartinae]|uniref:malonate transporter subunit MadL n=1 Tax=Marinomonas spartinae TaxID=1792290 RepID=UPI0018F1F917|nr:malonate transporter subunit MadL [Marinomonas spartinae]MBJ7555073.1 malonate transporter subunit MadL [Marinomonas spartinae]